MRGVAASRRPLGAVGGRLVFVCEAQLGGLFGGSAPSRCAAGAGRWAGGAGRGAPPPPPGRERDGDRCPRGLSGARRRGPNRCGTGGCGDSGKGRDSPPPRGESRWAGAPLQDAAVGGCLSEQANGVNERFINPCVELRGESWLTSETAGLEELLRALLIRTPGAGEAP